MDLYTATPDADYEPTEEDYRDWTRCLAERDAEERQVAATCAAPANVVLFTSTAVQS